MSSSPATRQAYMNQLRAAIHDGEPDHVVSTVAELDALLDAASAEAQAAGTLTIVMLTAPTEDCLSIVVDGEDTVLGYSSGHGEPPYYASVGRTETDEPALTAYVGLAHHTEFARRYVVAFAAGKRAAHEFLATGTRPATVAWVAV